MSRFFGEIRQAGYVTRDLMADIRYFSDVLGIGPWFLAERVAMNVTGRDGRPIAIDLRIALANSGHLQIELIEPVADGSPLYHEALQRSGGKLVLHHYSSWPDDLEAVRRSAEASGHAEIVTGRSGFGPFAYFRHPQRPDLMFEAAELSPQRRSVFGQIAQAAIGWDGSDPVRIGWPSPVI